MPEAGERVQAQAADLHDYHEGMTRAAADCFDRAVAEYCGKLANESRSIEGMEHVGEGPAEITAAHVEAAKMVLIRRLRRSALRSRCAVAARIGQAIMAAAAGVGASYFSQTWGAVLCVVAVFVGALLLLAERERVRES